MRSDYDLVIYDISRFSLSLESEKKIKDIYIMCKNNREIFIFIFLHRSNKTKQLQ